MKNNIKLIVCLVLGFFITTSGFSQSKTNLPLYKNSKASVESRIKDLLSRMTVEEKVGQVSMPLGWPMYAKTETGVEVSETFKKSLKEEYTGMLWATLRADPWTKKTLINGLNPELAAKATNAIQKYAIENTRLGIPILLSEECPHGHMAIGTTVFPTSIGQGSTFNPELIKKMAAVIAEETRLQGGHIGYGPVLDLAREPRWSRVEETYGEDHVLNSRMGEAMVQGFQGNNLKSGVNVIATLKHFAAYGAPEGGHNGGSINVGLRSLNQFYLPPFKAAVKAGALSVMTAYNSIDGIPCSSNGFLLNDLLRKEWNFKGFVVSDLNSISGLKANHHVAESNAEAAALSINTGLDADLSGIGYGKALREAIKQGKVSIKTLDTAVSRVLRIKFNMGLFENPYVNPETAKLKIRDAQKIALALQVARESIILLKNQNQTLPLSKNLKNIAVIGPNADNIYNQIGDYTAPQTEESIVTILKGIKNKLPETRVNYIKGCGIRDTTLSNINEAILAAKKSDAVVIVLGGSSARDFKTEYIETGAAKIKAADNTLSDMDSGEGFDRATLDLLGDQLKLLKAVIKTGKPVVLVLIKGRPLNLNWAAENVPAIIDAWYPGQEGGNAVADVIFGDYNPAGRLPISVPKSVGQLPVYYNSRFPEKHDYLEIDAKPLYSFGYGLSYTTFDYQNLKIATNTAKRIVNVSFDLKNSGAVDGEEVVQLYLKNKTSSVVLPVKQLKQFKRVFLKAGEQKTLHFTLNKDDLEIYNINMRWIVEPGTYQLMVSSSSDNTRLESQFVINKNSFKAEN